MELHRAQGDNCQIDDDSKDLEILLSDAKQRCSGCLMPGHNKTTCSLITKNKENSDDSSWIMALLEDDRYQIPNQLKLASARELKAHMTKWNAQINHGVSFPKFSSTSNGESKCNLSGGHSFVCACACTVKNSVYDPTLSACCPFILHARKTKLGGWTIVEDLSTSSHSITCISTAKYNKKNIQRIFTEVELKSMSSFSDVKTFEGIMNLRNLSASDNASIDDRRW